jgi:hypothetical protein
MPNATANDAKIEMNLDSYLVLATIPAGYCWITVLTVALLHSYTLYYCSTTTPYSSSSCSIFCKSLHLISYIDW